MKNKISVLKIILYLFMVISSIAIVVLALLYLYDYNINIIIIGIGSLFITIFYMLFIKNLWIFINEVSKRFSMDKITMEQLKIETELNIGNITKENEINYKQKLQKNINFFNSIEKQEKTMILFNKILSFVLMSISIILLIVNIINVLTIYNKYILGMLIIGIIIQFIILIITIFKSIIIKIKALENIIEI